VKPQKQIKNMPTNSMTELAPETLALVRSLILLITGRELGQINPGNQEQVVQACVQLYIDFLDEYYAQNAPERLKMQYKLSQTAAYQNHVFSDLQESLAVANQNFQTAVAEYYAS
jgi:hypothetical protein